MLLSLTSCKKGFARFRFNPEDTVIMKVVSTIPDMDISVVTTQYILHEGSSYVTMKFVTIPRSNN